MEILRDARKRARERLEYHVLRGEKWALELYFKIFTQLFDKSWLSRVDLTDIQLKMDSNADKEELIRMLMNKLLGLGTIEVTEAKDIIKMLTTLSFNDSVKQSIAMKLPESDVVKIRDMIRIVENNK